MLGYAHCAMYRGKGASDLKKDIEKKIEDKAEEIKREFKEKIVNRKIIDIKTRQPL